METGDTNEQASSTCRGQWGLMSALEKCIAITEKLIQLAKSVNEEERESVIQQINDLLEQRSLLFPLIEAPYSSEETVAGKKLLSLNSEMEKQLKNMQNQIQKDISELSLKKKSAERYTNPYAATTHLDGMFYDKRK